MRSILVSLFLAAAAATATANAVDSLPLHLKLAGMVRAEPPQVMEGRLILSAAGPYRFVGAAFEHEGFALIHPLEKNRQGVFVLAYPIPLERSAPLVYRFVVDGVWTSDPSNPRAETDPATGAELSVAEVPTLSDLHLGVYRLLDDDGRTARFIFRGAPGEVVTVSGDFDNWDPFIHEMTETSPGTYELALPLPPGIHYYAYVYRGELRPDPLNVNKASTRDGKVVSVLFVGQ